MNVATITGLRTELAAIRPLLDQAALNYHAARFNAVDPTLSSAAASVSAPAFSGIRALLDSAPDLPSLPDFSAPAVTEAAFRHNQLRLRYNEIVAKLNAAIVAQHQARVNAAETVKVRSRMCDRCFQIRTAANTCGC